MIVTPYLAQQTVNDFSARFSNLIYSCTLGAATDTTLTVPGNAPSYKALIKTASTTPVWIAINATAAVPAGATFVATTSEIIVETLCREVRAGDVLHFYHTAGGAHVSVSFYANI